MFVSSGVTGVQLVALKARGVREAGANPARSRHCDRGVPSSQDTPLTVQKPSGRHEGER
ncbi:hypothetical protein GCM10010298_41180 [Streptomyces microflavus]|uniref:Uncharacterized protein n=1 Tax=Streptomyces microflavus TaxID=1919 RepID=A0A7J0D2S1_STRMI|nr:hypothetical protein Smic_69130 [Streptomyces microflavus]GGX72054.1 hypothetical protein GCM10010298_41180 [Streptomyces microflavus]